MLSNKWMQKFVAGAMVAVMVFSIGAVGAKAAQVDSPNQGNNSGGAPTTPVVVPTPEVEIPAETPVAEPETPAVTPATPVVTPDTPAVTPDTPAAPATEVAGATRDNSNSTGTGTASTSGGSTGSSGSSTDSGAVLGATRANDAAATAVPSVDLGGQVLGAGRSPKTADNGNGLLVMLAVLSFAGAGALVYTGKRRA